MILGIIVGGVLIYTLYKGLTRSSVTRSSGTSDITLPAKIVTLAKSPVKKKLSPERRHGTRVRRDYVLSGDVTNIPIKRGRATIATIRAAKETFDQFASHCGIIKPTMNKTKRGAITAYKGAINQYNKIVRDLYKKYQKEYDME